MIATVRKQNNHQREVTSLLTCNREGGAVKIQCDPAIIPITIRVLKPATSNSEPDPLFDFTSIFNTFEEKKMEAQEYNRTYNIPFYFNDLLKLIKSLPIQEKLKIEKELENETLLYRSKLLSKKIKENSFDLENIVAEIAEYRSGKK
jgi:hypothetical protein